MERKVRKRTGEIVDFDPERISTAIFKAAQSVGGDNHTLATVLAELVIDYVEFLIPEQETVDIETIQDLIEKVLIEENHVKTAKSFILYRQKRKDLRDAKFMTGVVDDCDLSLNAIKVLESRYLLKDKFGRIIETPRELFVRVAKHIARAETSFGQDPKRVEEQFTQLLLSRDFMPNSSILLNAGFTNAQISSCCVLPIEDSTESIFTTLRNAAAIQKRGAGTGFDFSKIRPRGDIARGAPGAASGPLEVLKIYDKALNIIKQGGKRAGANMAILRIDHPDILDFITCKENRSIITNFNLSVAVTDEFIKAVRSNSNYKLIHPQSQEIVGELNAKSTFDLLCTMAWKNADPGIIFVDKMNNEQSNPTPLQGTVSCTSPCGEFPLLAFESAVEGAINLANHVIKDAESKSLRIDFRKLERTVSKAIHFLDNATQINCFFLSETKSIVDANRKIGLGVMGFADMLIRLRVPYNTPQAREIAQQVMKCIRETSWRASCELANQRGEFPNCKNSVYAHNPAGQRPRNALRTVISPTGTMSLLASCSPSIEPLYGISFLRKTAQFELLEVNPLFEEVAQEEGFYSDELMRIIALRGGIKGVEEVPQAIQDLFVTAMELQAEDHVRMQSVFQQYIDGAVSKTVNIPYYASIADVQKIFHQAYDLNCKGITIYRDGSRNFQVLTTKKKPQLDEHIESTQPVSDDARSLNFDSPYEQLRF